RCRAQCARRAETGISNAMRTCSRYGKTAGSISPRTNRTSSGQSSVIVARLAQPVGVFRGQAEPIHALQSPDLFQGGRRERRLTLERVQHHTLEKIAERDVEVGGKRLQYLQQAGLEAYAGLGADDGLHPLMVPKYQGTTQRERGLAAARRLLAMPSPFVMWACRCVALVTLPRP